MVLLKALQSINFELNEDMPNTEEHKLIFFFVLIKEKLQDSYKTTHKDGNVSDKGN